jgi:hypothetical protein
MTASRLFSSVFGGRPRPVLAPTALSMLVVIGLFALALVLPDRANDRSATAAEFAAVSLEPATPLHPLTLHDRLVVGLEARIPSEIVYVDRVVALVDTGRLPERLVNETFFWARERAAIPRNGRLRRGIIYFQPAMTARAKRLGIIL